MSNSPQLLQSRIADGVQTIKLQSLLKVEEFLVSGAMGNELGVWMEEPTVELRDGLIIISERMRVL